MKRPDNRNRQRWCLFAHPELGACSFGLGHRIEYHLCSGKKLDRNGVPLTPEAEHQITRGGTR